jgi:hypothetical protein
VKKILILFLFIALFSCNPNSLIQKTEILDDDKCEVFTYYGHGFNCVYTSQITTEQTNAVLVASNEMEKLQTYLKQRREIFNEESKKDNR